METATEKLKFLLCSDGHAQAENAVRFVAPIAAASGAEVTLLGIIEAAGEEAPLLKALERAAEILRDAGITPELATRKGEPVEEIRQVTAGATYDLVVIGAESRRGGGPSWMTERAYGIIKLIEPPVLAVIGERPALRKIALCSGGKRYIDNAVKLIGRMAGGSGIAVTLVHVMALPPAMYADMIRQEEDVQRLLDSPSDLGRNLLREKKALEAKGFQTEVRLRHGLVVRELFEEFRLGVYDMVVVGSPRAAGPLGSIMGDVTSEVVNGAECPVLVVPGEKPRETGFLSRILGLG